jgi:transposase
MTDEQWHRVADLFDPPGRRGAPARIPRRQMVDAMLFLARSGCQWRHLPERYGTSPRAHGPDANADSAQAYASLQEPSHGWGSATSNVSTPSLIA